MNLIEDNLKLVHMVAQEYKGRGIEYDDLVSTGNIGLVKAAQTYDESKGYKFSTCLLYTSDIKNLLLLPSELHQRYHNCISSLCGADWKSGKLILYTELSECGLTPYGSEDKIHELATTFKECRKWLEMCIRDSYNFLWLLLLLLTCEFVPTYRFEGGKNERTDRQD